VDTRESLYKALRPGSHPRYDTVLKVAHSLGAIKTEGLCAGTRYLRLQCIMLRRPFLWYSFYTIFEFDNAKSTSNKAKHGIDFVEAQALWDDPYLLEVPAKTVDEPRYLVVGAFEGKHWSAVITYRDENIRIISVRRARAKEVALYES
jgi:uncharacterized DUF497 family protein